MDGLRERLGRPVPADSVAVLRCGFGLAMAWSMMHYVFGGRAERLLTRTLMRFDYPGFGWLPTLPDSVVLGLCWLLLACCLAIAVGFRYRVAAAVFAFGYAYVFLYDAANYNNHDYLIVLLGLLLAVIPGNAVGAVGSGATRRDVPSWGLWILRFQVGVPYVFGGLAKLNHDWIVRREPMTMWFREGRVEGLARRVEHPELWGTALSWGGLLFDLGVVPLLLWKRTRVPAYAACVAFHLTNSQLFTIGPFPWLMIFATTIFLAPTWPRRLLLTRDRGRVGDEAPAASRLVVAGLAAWILVQLVLPFRHFAYPGWVDWTEEGGYFAWRMKLRDKVADIDFELRRPGLPWQPVEGLGAALTERQQRLMEHHPEMIRQFAAFLAGRLDPAGTSGLEIRALTSVSLNGRPRQPIVDPEIDLLSLDPWTPAAEWIVPLRPLPP